jgi:hypothetical protein
MAARRGERTCERTRPSPVARTVAHGACVVKYWAPARCAAAVVICRKWTSATRASTRRRNRGNCARALGPLHSPWPPRIAITLALLYTSGPHDVDIPDRMIPSAFPPRISPSISPLSTHSLRILTNRGAKMEWTTFRRRPGPGLVALGVDPSINDTLSPAV